MALVTGGASGLGWAISKGLQEDGARIVITDVQVELGRQLASEEGYSFIPQDVTSAVRWDEVVQEVVRSHGCIDILVNNAGIVGSVAYADPERSTLEEWRRVLSTNVDSVFLGCRAIIPVMRRAGGGAIVNVASTASLQALPEAVAYGASKAAVRHVTRSIALYCARNGSGIRCNSVHPGNVGTPLLERAMREISASRGVSYDAVLEEFKGESPRRTLIPPEEVAYAVQFLVSDKAKHITGIQLVIDDGTTLMSSAS